MKILIIDDATSSRVIIKQSLKDIDCETLEAKDGQEGFDMIF